MFCNKYTSAPWTDGGKSPAQKCSAIPIDLTLFSKIEWRLWKCGAEKIHRIFGKEEVENEHKRHMMITHQIEQRDRMWNRQMVSLAKRPRILNKTTEPTEKCCTYM